MIDPNSIDLANLPTLPLEYKSLLPEVSCIYFAIDSLGTIQYIGQTTNLQQRWISHHRYHDVNACSGVRISYLYIDAPELLPEIESALIDWFKPVLNGTKIVNGANRFTFTIEPDLYEPLKAQAKKERRSIGSLLNWLAAEYLERQQGVTIEPTIQHGGDRKSTKGGSND